MSNQRTPTQCKAERSVPVCIQSHTWRPTIIKGYFLCTQCKMLAACRVCVAQPRGKPLLGYCQAHHHLRSPETEQEVFG
jgi:hypothetical protein